MDVDELSPLLSWGRNPIVHAVLGKQAPTSRTTFAKLGQGTKFELLNLLFVCGHMYTYTYVHVFVRVKQYYD